MQFRISKRYPWVGAIICAIALAGLAQTESDNGRPVSSNPDDARLVTSDIALFWRAFDQATPENAQAVYREEYLQKGSYGLRQFTKLRIGNAGNLAATIAKRPKYYASIRESTLRVASMEGAIRAGFRKLKELYPQAVFPDVYFTIGAMNSGGTTTGKGLLIGVEMYGITKRTPYDELSDWHKAVLKPIDALPAIVSHELIHYQQKYSLANRTLLAQAINEGAADFIAEMLSGGNINDHLHQYANPRERELWTEFQREMGGKDVGKWLYQGDRSKDRPADLGYWMGYKICEAYYKQARDKKQALREILEIKDFDAFLAASRYAEKFGGKQ
ncbi:MAG: DUF2268 domain-containing putative Zn-dependent protease [Blastocatellia bacterium]|nr:DUF2268 domain-containing putative Zn-dependent protease [Blastocatellia bacterium]